MNALDMLTATFNAECKILYNDWPEERGSLIITRLDPPVDPDKVMAALKRYAKYYKFMPTLADINTQLDELDREEFRRKREEHFQARQQESDAAYEQISSGQGLTGRAQYWHGRMKKEISLSAQYRAFLASKYGLDYTKPAHNRFLVSLIDRARDADGFLLPLDQAKPIAEQMVAEYRAEKSKGGPTMANLPAGPIPTTPTYQNAR